MITTVISLLCISQQYNIPYSYNAIYFYREKNIWYTLYNILIIITTVDICLLNVTDNFPEVDQPMGSFPDFVRTNRSSLELFADGLAAGWLNDFL